MPRNLPADCLNEIFEYLEDDDLQSCLLVSRFWCETSVQIFWREIQNFNTLLICLPNNSKTILSENGVTISASASRPPLFHYTVFIKSLWIDEICQSIIRFILPIYHHINMEDFEKNQHFIVIAREIFKMLMNQTSLKHLCFFTRKNLNLPCFNYPGEDDCLRDLTELKCGSDLYPDIFYKLSQLCHNLRSLKIIFGNSVSNGLSELVSVQKHIKCLELNFCDLWANKSQPFTNFPNTLTKLCISQGRYRIPWSLISKLSNLQELSLALSNEIGGLKDFKKLQHSVFPQLQILKFESGCPDGEYLIKFLENNGKNLNDLILCKIIDGTLNLDIGKFCPNLRSLCTAFPDGDIKSLKVIFNACQQLETMKMIFGDFLVNERELLEIVVEFSPKKFYNLSVYLGVLVFPETTFQWGLRSILERWANRKPCIPLSLSIKSNSKMDIKLSKSNIKIIEEFKKLGAIKKFKIKI
ncbi:9979_t:CDS:1 [Funneliformis mosseae]|uniref:9979_t:CDS:1 n=1 Tax=Funneliformis mosseae TaxID=27381 RepID=A0A9N9CR85_FUNMO|nr:9979_t:CDS:1 [Funneliformis mosseae]